MPPKEADQPPQAELADALETLTANLADARERLTDSGGHIVLRRLNRREYRNTIHAYFGMPVDIEVRLNKAEQWLDRPKPKPPFERPGGKLKTVDEIRLMYDLMVAAIQTDMTRVITYRQPVEGIFGDLGYKVLGHTTTHCTTDSEAYRASIARDQKQVEMVAYLIDRLKALKDHDGESVFHNSLIAYGSGIFTNHDTLNTPTLIAGHGGGGMKQGQHYVYGSKQTPLANLWLSMLNHVGIESDKFADSEGKLPGIFE